MKNNSRNMDFIELLQSSKRGKLKVYIGSVAGVGKTFRMLSEAHDLGKKNIDIVVGFVETHNRAETAELVEGLEIIPRIQYNYHDVIVEEMDLDAILSRKPEVVIVDELAHTNLPMCRNPKRYQDVIELLINGINVICAFNIQHLESLNDIVQDATSIKVLETVPDSFLNEADQIVNIDLSAEDLLDRLESGKIYSDDKIPQALRNFFKVENLGQLRELALREVAERIEKPITVENIKSTSSTNRSSSDRLMVCLKPEDISQTFMLRKASRLAGKLNTDWFVVYIETPSDRPDLIDSTKQRNLYSDIQLAEHLGGQFIHLKADDRLNGWIKFATNEHVKHIVLNNSQFNFINSILQNSLLHILIKLNKFDLHIVSSNGKNEEEISR